MYLTEIKQEASFLSAKYWLKLFQNLELYSELKVVDICCIITQPFLPFPCL